MADPGCCTLYRIQSNAGRYWLHEHPWSAKSWKEPVVTQMLQDLEAMVVQCHQCQLGQVAMRADGSNGAVKKPTGFATNSWCLAEELDKKCPGEHDHVWLLGGRAKRAAIYPERLCDAICMGLMRQKVFDASHKVSTKQLNRGQLMQLIESASTRSGASMTTRPSTNPSTSLTTTSRTSSATC